jgi:hypothetical protein
VPITLLRPLLVNVNEDARYRITGSCPREDTAFAVLDRDGREILKADDPDPPSAVSVLTKGTYKIEVRSLDTYNSPAMCGAGTRRGRYRMIDFANLIVGGTGPATDLAFMPRSITVSMEGRP